LFIFLPYQNGFFLVKQVAGRGLEQRDPNGSVLWPLIIRILISYYILLIMVNHPSRNWKRNYLNVVFLFQVVWRSHVGDYVLRRYPLSDL